MSLDSSGGLASKVAKSNRNTHAVTSAAEPTSGGAGGGGYRGASENLRKMLKSHGVTVSSVDDMLSDQQPTQVSTCYPFLYRCWSADNKVSRYGARAIKEPF